MLKISVVLLIKNGEMYMKYLHENFDNIEKNFCDKYSFEYFIYENNSKDNTKKEIINFYESKNRKGKYFFVDMEENNVMTGINLERGKHMAFLRNKCKSYHGVLDSDYTLLLDADIIFSCVIIEKMIKTFDSYTYVIGSSKENEKIVRLPTISSSENPNPANKNYFNWRDVFETSVYENELTVKRKDSPEGWGQELELEVKPCNTMIALTVYNSCYKEYIYSNYNIKNSHYYDSFALISNKNITYNETDNTCLFSNCVRCINYRKKKNINLDPSLLISDNNITNVNSAFGGFFLMKTKIYNLVKWENTICEHHSFCENIRKYGDILLDPRLKVITANQENPKFLSYKNIQEIYL
jgi:hypothetical protein